MTNSNRIQFLHIFFVLLLLVFISINYLLPAITAKQTYGIEITESNISFVDFASHFNFVKSTLLGNDSINVTDLYIHLKIILKLTVLGPAKRYQLPFRSVIHQHCSGYFLL